MANMTEKQNARKPLISIAVGVVLFPISILVLFLCYAHWWERIFHPESIRAIDWLDTFQKFPWIRLPILWSICTAMYGCACQRVVMAAGYFVLFGIILPLSYPSLESLGLFADRSYAMFFLLVAHTIGACLIVQLGKVASAKD